MPELIAPTTHLHAAFLSCLDEWGPGPHEDGFGLGPDDDVRSPAGFSAWIDRRLRHAHRAGTPCPPQPHGTPRWIVEDEVVLGGIALRHLPDDDAGQLGYGVRASARGRGLAGWAVAEMLVEARRVLAADDVLVTCLDDNVPSIRMIERAGGVLSSVRETEHGRLRRYRVPLLPDPPRRPHPAR